MCFLLPRITYVGTLPPQAFALDGPLCPHPPKNDYTEGTALILKAFKSKFHPVR